MYEDLAGQAAGRPRRRSVSIAVQQCVYSVSIARHLCLLQCNSVSIAARLCLLQCNSVSIAAHLCLLQCNGVSIAVHLCLLQCSSMSIAVHLCLLQCISVYCGAPACVWGPHWTDGGATTIDYCGAIVYLLQCNSVFIAVKQCVSHWTAGGRCISVSSHTAPRSGSLM